MKGTILFLIFSLMIGATLAQQIGIGYPTGTCLEDRHYCGQNGCPFADLNFCQTVQFNCSSGPTPECISLVQPFCNANPTDPGCAIYGCTTDRPFRCPSSGVCVPDVTDCPKDDIIQCAAYSQACSALSACPGQYYCGRTSTGNTACRANQNDPCPLDSECGPYFPVGNGLCSTYFGGPPSFNTPLECFPTGQQVPNYCFRFQISSCNGGEHYCSFACSFQNATFCQELNTCFKNNGGQNCQALVDNFCLTYRNDLGCCTAPLIRCPSGACVADAGDCQNQPSSQSCQLSGATCPFTSPCSGQYYCGTSNGNPVCRSNLNDPCPPTDDCEKNPNPARTYACGYGVCSADPLQCQFGTPNGKCQTGFSNCGSDCPFSNYTFCELAGPLCGANITQACLNFVDSYCLSNPSDLGCCKQGQVRCLPSGVCAATLNDCPQQQINTCSEGNATCDFYCKGKYFCGPGATCRNTLNERCLDGPCAGNFYCGDLFGEPVCSDNPLQCQPPAPPTGPVACLKNGEKSCTQTCPFSNFTFCSTLDVCSTVEIGFNTLYSEFPSTCRRAIDAYCNTTYGMNDPGCCVGARPVRCPRSLLCAASLADCGSNFGCIPVGLTCPVGDLGSQCGPRYLDCGNGFCANEGQTCPVGSSCPGKYNCGSFCTDTLGNCNPNTGAPLPTCANGGVTCSTNQNCVDSQFAGTTVSVCVCKQGFVPDLTNPRNCIAQNQNGGPLGGCSTTNPCQPTFACNNGACQCPPGTVLDVNTGRCGVPVVPALPTVPTDAECSGAGDIHFTSFDQVYFDWQGTCDLVLAKNSFIEVQVRPFDCGGNGRTVSCVSEVGVSYGTNKIVMGMNGVTLNGNPVTSLPVQIGTNANLTGTLSQYGTVRFTFPFGVVESSFYSVRLRFDASLSSITEGFCGNWTAVSQQKLFHRGGALSTAAQGWGPYADTFAQSWIVTNADATIFSTPNTPCRTTSSKRSFIENVCNNDSFALAAAASTCAPILSYNQPGIVNCSQVLDLSAFYANCIYDVCTTSDAFFAQVLTSTVQSSCSFRQQIMQDLVNQQNNQVTGGNNVSSGSVLSISFALFVILAAFLF